MDWPQLIILSIVQGITEFLPISSSAHLILVPLLTDWPDQGVVFDIALHLGTLGAVMSYFWKDTGKLAVGGFQTFTFKWQKPEARLFFLLCLSTIPLILFALLVADFIASNARQFVVLGITSIFFGLLLWAADRWSHKKWLANSQIVGFLADFWPVWFFPKLYRKLAEYLMWQAKKEMRGKALEEKLTVPHALFFGLFQALALIPGTSRSGICMTAGRLMGFTRQESSHYALLMAIPVILLLGVKSMMGGLPTGLQWADHLPTFLWGMLLAFTTAWVAIFALMRWVNRIGFLPFVLYRVGLGLFLLVLA